MADGPKVLADTGPWKIVEIMPNPEAHRSIIQVLPSRDIVAKGDLQFTFRNLDSLLSALTLAKNEKEKLFRSGSLGPLESVDIGGEEPPPDGGALGGGTPFGM
jgi:hypothetical protein